MKCAREWLMADYPTEVRSGTGGAVFERRPDLYAVRQSAAASDSPAGKDAVAVIPDGAQASFAVYKSQPRSADPKNAGPVYSAGPDGPLAVPTGRVFVRLAEGVRAGDRQKDFEAAGFHIEQTLSYAPNAAWLRAASGGVERALPRLAELDAIPDVVHVEPQLLLQRVSK